MIVLYGSNGSMGKRYQAILKSLNESFLPIDVNNSDYEINQALNHCKGVILCTPTDTHFELIKKISEFKKPLLCEKPVTKNIIELKQILDYPGRFSMVMQYRHLTKPDDAGFSYYNYFRHGNDGLYWDCMQTIALAKGPVEVAETSPEWICFINGRKLNLQAMDRAYIKEIKMWLSGYGLGAGEIYRAHKRVADYALQRF